MIGTIANTIAIVAGSAIGSVVKRGLGERYQEVLFIAMGLAAFGLGIHSLVEGMTDSAYPVLFIASLAIGGVIGTALDINGRFDRLVDRASKPKGKDAPAAQASEQPTQAAEASAEGPAAAKHLQAEAAMTASLTTSEKPAPDSVSASDAKPRLAQGLSTAIVLFCFGTLSILGPINSALYGDETFLFTNAMLDFVTSLVLASSFGFGIAFAAVVLFCWQGGIWLFAQWVAPLLTTEMMTEISIVGGFLILASGMSILKIKSISVMNLLPALLVPALWFAILTLLPVA